MRSRQGFIVVSGLWRIWRCWWPWIFYYSPSRTFQLSQKMPKSGCFTSPTSCFRDTIWYEISLKYSLHTGCTFQLVSLFAEKNRLLLFCELLLFVRLFRVAGAESEREIFWTHLSKWCFTIGAKYHRFPRRMNHFMILLPKFGRQAKEIKVRVRSLQWFLRHLPNFPAFELRLPNLDSHFHIYVFCGWNMWNVYFL